MPNRRRKHRSQTQRASRAAESSVDADRWLPLGIALFLVGMGAYWVLFFRNELAPGLYAYERLAYLLLPDRVIDSWCGGEVGRVWIGDRLGLVMVMVLTSGVAGCLGWLILDLLNVRAALDRCEVAAFSIGLGFSGVSAFALAVGLCGGLRQPLWYLLPAIMVVGLAMYRWRQVGGSRGGPPGRPPADAEPQGEGPGGWSKMWWLAALPFAAAMLAGAALPPQDFDVLEYHLQVPKQWYQQGSVSFLPHNVYGNMPLGAEMLALPGMALIPGELSWWWGALAGKLTMALFPVLTMMLLFSAGRRWYSHRAGMVAALIYISTAWVAKVAMEGLNENAVAYYLFASFYAGRLWWDADRTSARGQWGWPALAGLLAGAAVACKYTSLVMVVLPLSLVGVWGLAVRGDRVGRWRELLGISSKPKKNGPRSDASSSHSPGLSDLNKGTRWMWGPSLIFVAAVAVACGLWLGKNWALAGNPTYPLLVDVFGGRTRTAEKHDQWQRAHQVPRDAGGRRYSLAQAGHAVADVLWSSPWQNPLIAPCAVLLLLRRRLRDIAYWAILLALVLLVWWLFTHRLTRFWVPAIPLMALLAGVGAAWSAAVAWRRAMTGVLIVGLLINFVSVVAPGLADNRFLVSLEQLRDDLRLSFGAHRALAYRYLLEHVPEGHQVLLVGDAAVFDLRVPAIYNTCFDDCQFEQLFRGRTRAERLTRLRARNISHVYIDWSELRRYRQPGNYGYSPYVTPALVHGELVQQQRLLRPVAVPGLEPELAELFEVIGE